MNSIENDNDIHPPTHTCWECGGHIFETEAADIWMHADTDEMDGLDIDLDHSAVPAIEEF